MVQVAQKEVRRYTGFASTVVGLVCYALSSSFNRLYGEWNSFKICAYIVSSSIICLAILFPKAWQHLMVLRYRAHSTFSVLTATTVYSFYLDRKLTKKPDAHGIISSAAFATTSLCVSKHICGFLDLMYFFCGLLVMQLMQVKLLLVFVGIGFSYFLVILHSYLDSPPNRSQTHPPQVIIDIVSSLQSSALDARPQEEEGSNQNQAAIAPVYSFAALRSASLRSRSSTSRASLQSRASRSASRRSRTRRARALDINQNQAITEEANSPTAVDIPQSQCATKSNSENEVPPEESINYSLTVQPAFWYGDERLKKIDSFSRWITKEELAEVDDLHMQSCPGISCNTDECGHVMIDDMLLSPSISQDQLFTINDFSPKWAYADSEIEVLIIGAFMKSQPEVATCNWSCMFGQVEVPAEVLADGIMCCQAPPHTIGWVPFYVSCSNRFACSEVREFEYREGFARNVDFADFFDSSTEMMLHLRLEDLLSSKSVHPSNQDFEVYMEIRNKIFKLISLIEEEEYSSKEEPAARMDISQHKLEGHMFHRQVKEKLYSWLLHKVTEGSKGPNVLDKDGQGVLHLLAALGFDWAITPIITAGVNTNFRDVNGWTALHWAASCGRERTVAVLVSMGASAGALTDPCPEFPSSRTPADLASSNGHEGISGFLGESLLTGHLASLTAIRNATQAADGVHRGFRRVPCRKRLLRA